MRDIRPPRPKKQATYTSQVEKTNVILPIDRQNIIAEPGNLLEEPTNPVKKFYGTLGPGLITGASDDDPSGIATYSVAGAQFGYQTLWLALFCYPLSAAVQEVCARIGIVTGHGLAAVAKKHYPKGILYLIVGLLAVANTINIGADIQAMAAVITLLNPAIDFAVAAVGLTVIILFFLLALSYKSYAKFLKLAALSLFSYVFVAFLSEVNWKETFHYLLVPTLSFHPAYLLTLVGILGTTISPYMFFWQANEEVEEEIAKGVIRENRSPILHKPRRISRALMKDMYIDVNVGMFYSSLIMFFIITVTAANLYSSGTIANVNDIQLDQLASVLRPLVGDTAYFLFAIGIIGIGMLAVPVLAGSASYAIAELFDWKEGLNKKFHEAKGFYVVIILATLVGLALNFIGIHPVAALYYTAIINGIVAVPLLAVIWLIGNNKKILGEHVSGPLSRTLVGITLLVMTAAIVALLVFG
jgi:NRAMP (natural resistance-associated macrophage protein)-like metal ion transporter